MLMAGFVTSLEKRLPRSVFLPSSQVPIYASLERDATSTCEAGSWLILTFEEMPSLFLYFIAMHTNVCVLAVVDVRDIHEYLQSSCCSRDSQIGHHFIRFPHRPRCKRNPIDSVVAELFPPAWEPWEVCELSCPPSRSWRPNLANSQLTRDDLFGFINVRRHVPEITWNDFVIPSTPP